MLAPQSLVRKNWTPSLWKSLDWVSKEPLKRFWWLRAGIARQQLDIFNSASRRAELLGQHSWKKSNQEEKILYRFYYGQPWEVAGDTSGMQPLLQQELLWSAGTKGWFIQGYHWMVYPRVPMDGLSRGTTGFFIQCKLSTWWLPGAGAQDQLLGSCSTSFRLFSTLPTAGSCTSRAPFDPCPSPSMVGEGSSPLVWGRCGDVCLYPCVHWWQPSHTSRTLYLSYPCLPWSLLSSPITASCFQTRILFSFTTLFHLDPSFSLRSFLSPFLWFSVWQNNTSDKQPPHLPSFWGCFFSQLT